MLLPVAALGQTSGPAGACASTVCLTVNSADTRGPATLIAQGFLHGDDTTSSERVANLHPTSWVVGIDPTGFASARANGATTTLVLSDLWYQDGPLNPVIPPWRDFSAYASWVQQTVAGLVKSGQAPDYWEVQNEPDGAYGDFPPASIAQSLEQFKIAVQNIRAADPSAKIVGPGVISPFAANGRGLDLQTFLRYVQANNLPLDAISWHEVGDVSWHIGGDPQPNGMVSHVAAIRAFLAPYPRLEALPIFINEYSAAPNHLIPGWGVGWIAAAEASGVAEATRSCWHEDDSQGKMVADCYDGSLDGLFQPGSGDPQDLYWVDRFYAEMTGLRLASSSTDGTVSVFSTLDSSSNTLRVLVGRHVSCTAAVRTECDEPVSDTPGPVPTTLQIALPASYSSAVVTVTRIGNVVGPMYPTIITAATLMSGSTLNIPIGTTTGGLADGDAYSVTLRLL